MERGKKNLMIGSQRNSWMGLYLATLLLIIQLFFQYKLFTFVFVIVLILMIIVAFLSEKNRVFVWTLVSFSSGLFIFIYVDRIILELSFSHTELLLLNRLLLALPILLMCYVIGKFKTKVFAFTFKMEWDNQIILPFIWWGFKKISVRAFLIIFLTLHLLFLLHYMWKSEPIFLNSLMEALLFSILNGVLVEVLWRGILLTRLVHIIGEKMAILFTSLSCALAYYLFGYSIHFCIVFFIIGLFNGATTCKTKSLIPAIIFNFLFTLILIFMNVIPILSSK